MNFKGFYVLRPHQGKEQAYQEALFAAGYRKSSNPRTPPRFALYDLDSGHGGFGWSKAVEELQGRGIPLFQYPHAARPMVQYDGIIEINPGIRCLFTHAEGGRMVMESFDIGKPVEVVGWSFCKIKPFTPVNEIRSVVFGPIHPNANGWLSDMDKKINASAFAKIFSWCKKNKVELTVRFLHTLGECGLDAKDGVVYTRGHADQSTADIDQADLVIGHQTFAYLAVARGKPTLMMGEDVAPRSGNDDSNFRYVKHWKKYRDLLMYPLDILAERDTDALIKRAISSDDEIQKWRELFIGEPFGPKKFVSRLEAYL
jgi:hypothetical protein